MRYVLIFAISAILSAAAFAATDVDPTLKHPKCNSAQCLVWEDVTFTSGTTEWSVSGGLYNLFIDGTPDSVDLNLEWGKTSGSLKDIDTDAMPDGVRFNSVSTNSTNVCLPDGFVDIEFSSAGGGSQNIDIWLTRLGDCQ